MEMIDMTNHEHGADVLNELNPLVHDLRQAIPEVMKAFAGLHAAAFTEGSLNAKTKELIALAISVIQRCDGCIAAHARGAARRGATEAEVAEAIGVAVLMSGGPATVYGPRAFAAFKGFVTEQPGGESQ
jgi:AhpD family alkylhydroperoxidase